MPVFHVFVFCLFFNTSLSFHLPQILWTPDSSQPLASVSPDTRHLLSFLYSWGFPTSR